MTDVAGPRTTGKRSKRRVPLVDTVAVRGVVWLGLAFVIIAPIAATRLLAPAAVPHVAPASAPPNPAPAPLVTPTPPPLATASTTPSNTIANTPPAHSNVEQVRDRLAAILRAYQNRDDLGTPESGVQAAGALHWCAQQLASFEHISDSDASNALSRALIEPRSADGLRVVSAIEAPAQGADETSRMHCASLLYAQLQQ